MDSSAFSWVPNIPESLQAVFISLATALAFAIARWIGSSLYRLWKEYAERNRAARETPKIERLQARLDSIRQVQERPTIFIARCVRGILGLLALFIVYFVVQYVLGDMLAVPVSLGPFRLSASQLVLSMVLTAAFVTLSSAWAFVRPHASFEAFEQRAEENINRLRAKISVSEADEAEAQKLATQAETDREVLEVGPPPAPAVKPAAPLPPPAATASGGADWRRGQIHQWTKKRYGHILGDDGQTYYANINSLVGTRTPPPGSVVYFRPSGHTHGGPYESADVILPVDQVVEGVVSEVLPTRAFSIARVTDANGKAHHLPMPFSLTVGGNKFRNGERVKFQVGVNRKRTPMAIGAVPVGAEDPMPA
ncbi:MAG: hypothetical protein JNJ73_00980 [Hyphomonadaceae bacterium]|nr:hypothetical protein [Hyphomonadaceae bacterium]